MNLKICLIISIILFSINIFASDLDNGNSYFQRGAELQNRGEYVEAIEQFNIAEGYFLNVRDSQQRKYMLSFTYLWRGMSYYYSFNYPEAEKDLLDALEISGKRADSDFLVSTNIFLANTYNSIDDNFESRRYFEIALNLVTRKNLTIYYASVYELLGKIEFSVGKYDDAEEAYLLALEYAEVNNQVDNIISIRNNLGLYYNSKEEYQNAFDVLEIALDIENSESSIFYGRILNTIGLCHASLGNIDLATDFFSRAIDEAIKNANLVEQYRLNMQFGDFYFLDKDYEVAIQYYFESMPLIVSLNRKIDLAVCYANIGASYYFLGNNNKAVDYLYRSITIKEELRNNAIGYDKLDYLASEMKTYKLLALCYDSINDLESVLEVLELSTAKFLQDQLLSDDSNSLSFDGIESFQNNMGQDQIILRFASFINFSNTLSHEFFIMTKDDIKDTYLHLDTEIIVDENVFRQLSNTAMQNSRGLSLIIDSGEFLDEGELEISGASFISDESFYYIEPMITYYRMLLLSGQFEEELYIWGRYLYDMFFGPSLTDLDEGTVITIIPEGYLAFLPFETLIMPDGRYLIEKFDISYVQSLAVSEIIRDRTYTHDRQDFLGFGGAEYSQFDPSRFPQEFGQLQNLEWEDLPGTESEVIQIDTLYDQSTIIISEEVTETNIKNLSESGELANYKVLHFATHGFVMPDMPQYTALVVTDFHREDGYLTAQEISELNIKADFVNLSACETGLGKLYGGEGVVGLAQAFLIAGANSLSVSLWKVSDQSTSEFMTGFYRLITEEGYSYKEAMSQIKREYINSEEYSHPYYWAPFIFYGE